MMKLSNKLKFNESAHGVLYAELPVFKYAVTINRHAEFPYIQARDEATKHIRDQLLAMAARDYDHSSLHDGALGIYGKYVYDLPDDMVLGNPETLQKVRHFMRQAHMMRIYGDDYNE